MVVTGPFWKADACFAGLLSFPGVPGGPRCDYWRGPLFVITGTRDGPVEEWIDPSGTRQLSSWNIGRKKEKGRTTGPAFSHKHT